MCKETVVAQLRYLPGIYLKGRPQIMKNLNENIRYPGRDSNRILP
jgi:hypothetical protein